mgnify:CR=1 FL=1
MKKDFDKKVENILDNMVGRRGNIDKIKEKIEENFLINLDNIDTVKVFCLVEDTDMEVVTDNALIGSIIITTKDKEQYVYDIQLFYIKDNLGNYYITETILLEKVSESFVDEKDKLELEYKKQLNEIQDIYTQGDNEPLDSDEVENLIKILWKQLDYINGNITEKEYLEDRIIIDNEIILNRLKEIQNNSKNSKITDILNIISYFENISLYKEIKEKIENKEINVENCYTNIKKMLEK